MRCAVLGSPIAHSLSPALHRAAYSELGLDWTYDAVDVAADSLGGFLDGLDATWRGLSLTMPLKRTAVALADSVDEWTRVSGVANTLLLESERRRACNTDVPGAVAAISERSEPPRSAVVLGGGATAASVVLALAELGCTSVRLLVRDPDRAIETVDAVRRHPHPPEVEVGTLIGSEPFGCDLLVSTVPSEAQTPDLVRAAADVPVLFEVVYDPWPTPLAGAALAAGQVLVSGLDLLAHQAALQVDLMTGETVPVDLLREAGHQELSRRAGQNSTGDA